MDREEEHPGLRSIEPVPDPFPQASFGSIGRFVKVECNPEAHFAPPRLTISYTPDDLGWVDPATLRVFEVDPDRGEFRLVARSMSYPERMVVHAFIERSGIYGLIGLPRDEALLRVIRALSVLIPALGEVDGIEVADLLGTVCGRILCVPPEERGMLGNPVPPGGVEGDACQFCLGLNVPSKGLPEFQLLPVPPHRRRWDWPAPPPPVPAGPYLYALLSDFSVWPYDAVIEIVDLSTMTYVQTIQLGSVMGGGIAATPFGVCVLDWTHAAVLIVDPAGGRRTVPVGNYSRHCVASPNGSKIYVTVQGSILEIDVVMGQITRMANALGQESFGDLSVSADGMTLAAGTEFSWSFVYVFDTATLSPRRVAVTDPQIPQVHAVVVRLADSGQVLVWDPISERMYSIDAATATQLPWVMDDLVAVSGSIRANVSYNAARRAAYVTRGEFYSETGDLVVVDLATSMGTVRGGFGGFPSWTCLNPRDGKSLYVSVENVAARQSTLDAYDTEADSFARGVYTFRNHQPGGVRHMAILG